MFVTLSCSSEDSCNARRGWSHVVCVPDMQSQVQAQTKPGATPAARVWCGATVRLSTLSLQSQAEEHSQDPHRLQAHDKLNFISSC